MSTSTVKLPSGPPRNHPITLVWQVNFLTDEDPCFVSGDYVQYTNPAWVEVKNNSGFLIAAFAAATVASVVYCVPKDK